MITFYFTHETKFVVRTSIKPGGDPCSAQQILESADTKRKELAHG